MCWNKIETYVYRKSGSRKHKKSQLYCSGVSYEGAGKGRAEERMVSRAALVVLARLDFSLDPKERGLSS